MTQLAEPKPKDHEFQSHIRTTYRSDRTSRQRKGGCSKNDQAESRVWPHTAGISAQDAKQTHKSSALDAFLKTF